jgi:hypothetical protein
MAHKCRLRVVPAYDRPVSARCHANGPGLVDHQAGAVKTSAPPPPPPSPSPSPRAGCDLAYPTVCIPPPPPDLDCKDVPYKNFKVLPPDPHKFDSDHDGIGCES